MVASVASFNRSLGLPPTTTRTEKALWRGLRLFGEMCWRWCVQTRPSTSEAAVVDSVYLACKTPCYGFLPAHAGVLLFTMFALVIGVAFIGVTAVNVAQNGASLVSKVGHILTDVLHAARYGMSTSSLLSPLYHCSHSSSSPVCSGPFAFVAAAHWILTQFTDSTRCGETI